MSKYDSDGVVPYLSDPDLDETWAEVERLRAENERLREDLAWMTAEAHAQREAAIYGAAWAENARLYSAKIIDPVECAAAASEAAEKAVEFWRAAQKQSEEGTEK